MLLICNYDTKLSIEDIRIKLRPLLATFNDLVQASPPSSPPRFALRPAATAEPSLAFSALDAMFDAVLLVGQQGNIEFCNEQACQILACHREELIGMSLTALMPEGDDELSGSDKEAIHNVSMYRLDGRRIRLVAVALVFFGNRILAQALGHFERMRHRQHVFGIHGIHLRHQVENDRQLATQGLGFFGLDRQAGKMGNFCDVVSRQGHRLAT